MRVSEAATNAKMQSLTRYIPHRSDKVIFHVAISGML